MTIKTHETNFIVMPKDCNWMDEGKLIFGGKMLAEMDLCAAGLIRKVLRSSPCDSAVTVGVDGVSFFRGAIAGDLVVLKATLWETGRKSIKIKIEGWIDKEEGLIKKCEGFFSWVTRKNGEFALHSLPTVMNGQIVPDNRSVDKPENDDVVDGPSEYTPNHKVAIGVHVNGKNIDVIWVPIDLSAESLEEAVKSNDSCNKHFLNKEIKRVIVVPNKLINIIV